MTKSNKTARKPAKIRMSIKFYRLIFTGLMALLMSLIISASLILVKEGYTDLFFDHLLSSWKLAFVFAWPSAYLCAYVIQTHVLSRIDFY